MVAVSVPDGVAVCCSGASLISGTTWEVLVYSGSYGSYIAFNEPVLPEIFAFAPPGAAPSGSYGVSLRDGGVLRWDLSQRPLWIRQVAALSAVSSGGAGFTDTSFGLIGGLTKPAVIGSPGGWWDAANDLTERYVQGRHAWCRSGSAVYRRPVMTYHTPGSNGTSVLPFPTYSLESTFAVVIDAANLP